MVKYQKTSSQNQTSSGMCMFTLSEVQHIVLLFCDRQPHAVYFASTGYMPIDRHCKLLGIPVASGNIGQDGA